MMTDRRGRRRRAGSLLSETDFLVVDVETTGLSADGGDRVCEIGAVRLRGGAVISTFGTLIDPERPLSAGAYAVNGISPQMLAGAPPFTAIAAKFAAMLPGTVLVAYNAPFDLSFLRLEMRLAGMPAPPNRVVDALPLARQLVPGLRRYSQDAVARILGIGAEVRHRALDDALVTARIFTLLTGVLKAADCTEVDDLARRDLGDAMRARRMQIVDAALEAGRNLWIRYLADEEITERIITPRSRTGGGATPFLIGYCHHSRGEKNFRIDRMLDLRVVPDAKIF